MLLVSGGETLELANRVCSYSAGTDTNPIFMFSNDLEQRNPPAPWPSIDNGKQFRHSWTSVNNEDESRLVSYREL